MGIESFCKTLPKICERLNPKRFKKYLDLEEIFSVIFYAFDSDVRLTSAAAEDCLVKLGGLISDRILKSKVANFGRTDFDQKLSTVLKNASLVRDINTRQGSNPK